MRNQRREAALLERPTTTTARRLSGADQGWPSLTPRHKVLFGLAAAFYLVVIIAVLDTSRLVALDWDAMLYKPYEHWPALQQFLNLYVIAGQRGPSAIVVALWLGWRSWRSRSMRPLLVLGVSLVLLNMSVGAVKIGMGRLGPHYAHVVGSSALFQSGGIFPSGHTANAVVTWGVVAYLALRWRQLGAVIAGFMGITIGLTTVYLGTHWISDVLAGWAAGAIVLLALPLFEPVIASADDRLSALWAERRVLYGRLTGRPVDPGQKACEEELQAMTELSGEVTAALSGPVAESESSDKERRNPDSLPVQRPQPELRPTATAMKFSDD